MLFRMSPHVTDTRKALLADGTAVRPLTCVHPKVNPQFGRVPKAFSTKGTTKGPLARVHQTVAVKLGFLSEAAATYITHIRPQACVDVFVTSQVGSVGKATVAQIALVLLAPHHYGWLITRDTHFFQKLPHGKGAVIQFGLCGFHAVKHVAQTGCEPVHHLVGHYEKTKFNIAI